MFRGYKQDISKQYNNKNFIYIYTYYNMRIRKYEALVTKSINKCMFDCFIYLFLAYQQNGINSIKFIIIFAPYISSNYLISVQTNAHI